MGKDQAKLKVAFVTDWMASPGGADRLLLSLVDQFPNSEIFTTIYNRELYTGRYQVKIPVHESFLSKWSFVKRNYRHFNVLSPLAFESFDFRGFDLVISLSAGSAKGVITQINQPHIGIILTPPRGLWDNETNLRGLKLKSIYKVLTPITKNYLRIWDQTAINRVDKTVSISKFIQKKVKRVYDRNSEVLYPGIEEFWFDNKKGDLEDLALPEQYFLVVSRLYDYKNVDWAIKSAKEAGMELVVVGVGPDMAYLEKLGGDETTFLGWVADEQVRGLYKNAEALLFCGVEDYGYVPVEAMASGCPVLAYNKGGVKETVLKGKTGDFFGNRKDLTKLLENHDRNRWDEEVIIGRAREFSVIEMGNKLKEIVDEQVQV